MTAGATYVPITTQTLGSAAASVTFSSIPQGYTDLVFVFNGYGVTYADDDLVYQVGNGSVDTATNYSFTYILGSGSAASSGRVTSNSLGYSGARVGGSTTPSVGTINFMNYSNTTTYKTALGRGGTGSYVSGGVSLWRGTSAINIIKILTASGESFATGSTFTLYGIAAA